MWLETADFNSDLASPMSYAVPAQNNEWLMELVTSQTISITLQGSFQTRTVIPEWAAGATEVRKVCKYAMCFNLCKVFFGLSAFPCWLQSQQLEIKNPMVLTLSTPSFCLDDCSKAFPAQILGEFELFCLWSLNGCFLFCSGIKLCFGNFSKAFCIQNRTTLNFILTLDFCLKIYKKNFSLHFSIRKKLQFDISFYSQSYSIICCSFIFALHFLHDYVSILSISMQNK